MDEGSGSTIWQRLSKFFHSNSSDTVEQAIREASQEGELDKEEGSMLLNVLSLDDMQVQEVMTPRTDIVCISASSPIKDIIEIVISSGHSRIPIYQENRDNFIGIVHAKDLLTCALSGSPELVPKSILQEPFFIPETKNVLELLQEFRTRKQHLAIILDEYGGTAGLVSIEDLIEVIVGDIEDEHDAPRTEEIQSQPDGTYVAAGRTDLEDISERLSLHIDSEEVDTIGGYLSLVSGRMPKPGDTFTIDNAIFSVLEADARQIYSIRITLPNSESTLVNPSSAE